MNDRKDSIIRRNRRNLMASAAHITALIAWENFPPRVIIHKAQSVGKSRTIAMQKAGRS